MRWQVAAISPTFFSPIFGVTEGANILATLFSQSPLEIVQSVIDLYNWLAFPISWFLHRSSTFVWQIFRH